MSTFNKSSQPPRHDFVIDLYPHLSNQEAMTEIQQWAQKNARGIDVKCDSEDQTILHISCDERTKNDMVKQNRDIIYKLRSVEEAMEIRSQLATMTFSAPAGSMK